MTVLIRFPSSEMTHVHAVELELKSVVFFAHFAVHSRRMGSSSDSHFGRKMLGAARRFVPYA